MAPRGPESPCCTGRPADSARHARGARGETAYDDPAHHRLISNRGVLADPTHQASPNTARAACDTVPPVAHDMPDAVARPVPTPRGDISGSRVTHGRGEKRTP